MIPPSHALDDFCPSEEELVRLLGATADPGEREKLLLHVDVCPGCRLAIAETTRALANEPVHGRTGATGPCTLGLGERLLGRYEIRRFIARGGMGEVYEAVDMKTEHRVALKTLAATALDDASAALRFEGEARLARMVTHPNVCRILDFGIHRQNDHAGESHAVSFFTMEYLEGETLAHRIGAQGPLSGAAAMPLVHSILAGLSAIHDAGIVHRDLKSENVFLVADAAGTERAILMDFGLARALDGSVLTTLPHVLLGLVGTIDCMAPEQIEGATRVGPPADIYAMGVLLFEILTGRRPFSKMSPAVRLTRPAPLPSSLVPNLDRAWDSVITRCLARRPEDRFATLAALRAALPTIR